MTDAVARGQIAPSVPHWLRCSWSKWVVTADVTLMDEGVPVGRGIEQQRTCAVCGKLQIRMARR